MGPPRVLGNHCTRFDTDAIVATFAEDAFINDARREFRGIDAIRARVERHCWGQGAHRRPRGRGQPRRHHRPARPRRGLRQDGPAPGELIQSNYFGVRDGKISSLIVIRDHPAVLR